jgi:prophage regulatory protein
VRLFLCVKEESMTAQTSINETKLLRVAQIIGNAKADPPIQPLIPIGRSSWWQKVRSGEAPAPIKIGKRVTVWRASDIERYIATLGTNQGG